MNIYNSVLESLGSLNANKLRSALTILGIVIGVAAVIAMLSIGRGAQQSITNQITSIGTNLIYVTPGAARQGGVVQAAGTAGTLTLNDATALEQIPGVLAVAPEVDGRAQIVYQGQNTNTRLLGVTPDYQTLSNMTLDFGSFISSDNVTANSSVVVLGNAVAATLFGDTSSAVGQTITINRVPFNVTGVLTAKGGTGFLNQDDQVFVPLTTAQHRLTGSNSFRGADVISVINVQANSAKNVNTIMMDVTDVMRQQHNTSAGTDDFTVTSQQATLAAATQITNLLSIFLGGIAGISLLVGGIGIMNIMLTTVSERTHEIGIRKAIGARRNDILLQFLVEATTLSLMGGIIGVILGWLIALMIGHVQLGGSAITPIVSIDSILLATLFSLVVGLFFGIYPAARASALQPVEALRYE
jgi:putative ABC transport system permease protein